MRVSFEDGVIAMFDEARVNHRRHGLTLNRTAAPPPHRRVSGAIAVALTALVAIGSAGPRPTMQADQPLARYVPAEGLIALFEFDGLQAHQAAWTATASHAVLAKTSTGAMLRALITQLADVSLAQTPNPPVTGAQLTSTLEHTANSGFVVGVGAPTAGSGFPVVTAVFRGAGNAAIKSTAEQIARSAVPEGAVTQVLTRQDGRRLVLVRGGEGQPSWLWWFEGEDLVISIGTEDEGADRIVETLADPAKSAAQNPIRAQLANASDGFEPVAWGWVDATLMPPTPPELGLSGLKRVDYRWGFQGKELVGISHVVAPKPRTGLLALFDQASITGDSLPPVPAGAHAYVMASLDLARAYDIVVKAASAVVPDAQSQIDEFNESVTKTIGLNLRDDLFAAIGSRWAFYVEPRTINAPLTPINAIGAWLTRMPPALAVAEVRDAGKLGAALGKIAGAANPLLAGTAGSDGKPLLLTPLESPGKGLRLVVPPTVMPLPTSVDPGLMFNEKYVGISNSLDGPRHALAIANGAAARLTPDASLLPPGLVYLEVRDPRDGMPELIANLPFFVQLLGRAGPGFPIEAPPSDNPFTAISIERSLIPRPDDIRAHVFPGSTVVTVDDEGLTMTTRDSIPTMSPSTTLPVALGLLLPAVQQAREAAQRAQSTNNLKQIALAMHNYLASFGDKFPDDIRDADGKPLLSWRVAILPYIEETALYQQFHIDEPWDSAHNKPLMESVPRVYAALGAFAKNTPTGHTYYQVIRGEGGIFEKDQSASIANITDGTSNTILAVEAGTAVPWTKPADVEYDPEKDVPMLGGMRWSSGGYNAAFADGSVKFIKNSIAMEVLKALISRAGGEVVSADDF